jgi:uncharacterized cupin superfamily protein
MHHAHLPTLPWKEQSSPRRTFHSFSQDVSLALGGIRNGGPWVGGHPFDVQIRRVPPGAAICPFHLHLAQWELFVVQRGRGTVRTTEGRHSVYAGDVFFHPPGEPHQVTNTGTDDLEVLIVADNPPLDACFYPDSHKWALRPPGKVFRMQETGYYDGEEPPLENAAPYHLDAVAWEEWRSPKGRFRGASKELSIALGAKRSTPTGLGGHPFDLEFQKLAPGECGCPFHSHAAQWELFLIVSGSARVRSGEATRTFGPGDAILHPPGEAHRIDNASATEDLLFYLIADNPPVDYWHYPDSGKWGLRAPRMFFRTAEAEYYDGEE